MASLYNTRETFSNVALYPNTLTDDPNAEPGATICSICTDDYSTLRCGALRMPDCLHIFCATCIKTWFDTASTCPMCRKDFFPLVQRKHQSRLSVALGIVLFVVLRELRSISLPASVVDAKPRTY
jgi:hypothetical protein